jgi:hypothetical protein
MKQPSKSPNLQLNLPLLSVPATVIPDQRKDLTLALIELLLIAADEGVEPQNSGGGNDVE